ncbi:class I SAM-dependent methyltransferase [Thalassospira sp.]|uniref:class I SAM-dependent methyltransferase n=1 Tax=Thalassospira sp. TaxID=1912094 RepID=UPI003AA857C2
MSSQLPADWIVQHTLAPTNDRNRALDLACGKGRHSFWLRDQGWQVTAIDRDLSHIETLHHPDITWMQADLETGQWPLKNQKFDLIVVVNYLHRPLFDNLRAALNPGGTLMYETFMAGNELYGRPRSPDFLLQIDELRDLFSDWGSIAFRQGPVLDEKTKAVLGVKQSIVTQKPDRD